MDWTGKNILNAGQTGPTLAERMQKNEATRNQVGQNVQMFEQVKPLLMKCLEQRIQSRTPIKVLQPIEIVVERIAKSSTNASVNIAGDIIPSGLELVFDGMELGQLFFKSYRNGQEKAEYSIHLGENIVIGPQQVARNKGLMGLLTKTDITTEVLEYLKQK